MKAYEEWRSLPPEARADCRGRQKVDLATTDREIFESLSLGDVWVDSRVHEVFLYLYGCKNVQYLGCISGFIYNCVCVWPPKALYRAPQDPRQLAIYNGGL